MKNDLQSESTGFTADELTRLRELASKARPSGWRDYSLLIAGAGFALALATGMISAYVGYRKDIHDQRAELAATLQQIQDLTLKQAETYDKYKGTEFENTVTSAINAGILTAVKTASDLALSLGSNATTAEFTIIGQSEYKLGDYVTAEILMKNALSAAQNALDKSIALRDLGSLKIHTGGTVEARKDGEAFFFRAMTLQSKSELQSSPYLVHYLRAGAAFDWADAIAPFDCAAAQTHFAEGVENIMANPRRPEMDLLRRNARHAYSAGLGEVLTCKPSKQTVLPP